MGGLLGNPIGIKKDVSANMDFDTLVEPGIYSVQGNSSSVPYSTFGLIIVCKGPNDYLVQIRFNADTGTINYRFRTSAGYRNWNTFKGI